MRRTATRALATGGVAERVLYSPRTYQKPAIDAWEAGADRLVTVWHRSAGKDQTMVEVARRSMFGGLTRRARPGLYFHVFPTFALGRDALWNAGSDGRKNLDVFPVEFLARDPNETEMQFRFNVPGGEAIWQVMGADDPDAFRGTRPVGVTYSEYAEMSPEVERVLDPVLSAARGWKAFAYTPKGRNHGYELYQFARGEAANGNAQWYVDLKTVDDTRQDAIGESGEPVITAAYIDEQRRRGVPEEFIQQEYYCSFDASLVGSYYGDQLRAAERDGRICRVPWHPTTPVITAWDLGFDDYTAVWFVQPVGRELRVIDYLEAEGEWMPFYAKRLKELEYVYAEHLLPHDAEADNVRGPTIQNQLRELKVGRTRIVPKESVQDGIQAVRALFPKLVFDEVKTRLGRERLAAYRKDKDADGYYKAKPHHDKASDAADALRTLAMGLRTAREITTPTYARSATSDVYGDQRATRVAQSETARW